MGIRERAHGRSGRTVGTGDGPWRTGDTILWTYRNPRFPDLADVYPVTVVSDDDHGLVAWLAPGTEVLSQVLADGSPIRSAVGPAMFTLPRAQAVRTWFGAGILVVFLPGQPFTISFFELPDGSRAAYYVNLELPPARTREGIEGEDLVLDILVSEDRSYRFKDEDELEFARAAGVYSEDDEAFIREAAGSAIALIEEWAYPFGVGLEHFQPDPAWPLPRLPADTVWTVDLRAPGGPS